MTFDNNPVNPVAADPNQVPVTPDPNAMSQGAIPSPLDDASPVMPPSPTLDDAVPAVQSSDMASVPIEPSPAADGMTSPVLDSATPDAPQDVLPELQNSVVNPNPVVMPQGLDENTQVASEPAAEMPAQPSPMTNEIPEVEDAAQIEDSAAPVMPVTPSQVPTEIPAANLPELNPVQPTDGSAPVEAPSTPTPNVPVAPV